MTRKRGSTFFNLDVVEAVAVQCALKGLLREIDRLPSSDKVKDLEEIATEVAARLDKRMRKVRKP